MYMQARDEAKEKRQRKQSAARGLTSSQGGAASSSAAPPTPTVQRPVLAPEQLAAQRAASEAASAHAQQLQACARARDEAEQIAARARQEAAQAAARAERWEVEARARREAAEAASCEYSRLREALKSFEKAFMAEHGRKPTSRSEISADVQAAYARRKDLLASYPGLHKGSNSVVRIEE